MLNRRTFLQVSAGASVAASGLGLSRDAAAATFQEYVEKARAAGETEVIVSGPQGAWGQTIFDNFYSPFTAATGIDVRVVGGTSSERAARMVAMNQVGQIEWDMVTLSPEDIYNPKLTQYLVNFGDCSELTEVQQNALPGACLGYGIEYGRGGNVMAYDARAFPDGGPQNWVDFWNIGQFPGPRGLPNYGRPWYPLCAALMADGVAPANLFPMDLERAFSKMDEIREHVSVWWTSGDQCQQMFRTQEVVAGLSFFNRMSKLRFVEGLPIFTTWNQGFTGGGPLAVLENALNPNAARALLSFIFSDVEAAANYASQQHVATLMRGADEFLEPEFFGRMGTNPENAAVSITVNPDWVREHREQIIERWTSWISA